MSALSRREEREKIDESVKTQVQLIGSRSKDSQYQETQEQVKDSRQKPYQQIVDPLV